jgi:hypothetical protein
MENKEPYYREVTEDDYILVGPDGAEWTNVTDWLEPREVRQLVHGGALLALHLCEGWIWGAELTDDVMSRVVTGARSHKLARGKYPAHVIYAPSLWRNDAGAQLVLLSEEVPKRKKVIRELRGNYRLADLPIEGWNQDR